MQRRLCEMSEAKWSITEAKWNLFEMPAYTHQIPNGISSHLLRDNMYIISKDKGCLQHILLSIERVQEFTKGMSKEELVNDTLHLHATVYNVQIVGEAVYKLTKEFKESHTETPWRMIENCLLYTSDAADD